MQLLEQGKLSLDTDVNEYLDFTIPATFPEPITLRNLLSHTAGFERKGTNLWRLQTGQMIPLGDWVKDNLPARVFPAGEIAATRPNATLANYFEDDNVEVAAAPAPATLNTFVQQRRSATFNDKGVVVAP